MQSRVDAIAGQPSIHPWPEAGGHLLQQLGELKSAEAAQIAHIHMPKGLGFANQASPGASVLPALHALMHNRRRCGMTASRKRHEIDLEASLTP
jgi:hypothetical protein